MAAACVPVLGIYMFLVHKNENKNCNLQKFCGKKPNQNNNKPAFKNTQYCLTLSTRIFWNPYSITTH